ncbi:hypothetical protein BO70DRAFT_153791 [Aspergillus heteromorphus CBS 117.55]|uniref:Uncharacterized protein n=1 Tax=Aspergillus heteromorphus CBS 117.55 TaxID=1448321 RepID=A0A317V589_9EURO|nr:uncharacterized protein BO70DRAFT_153791 [Aspergillus heteromorphus CBS 117.55]PWY68451.1 hypothetical protein BO70DRAFT_153791 [Aspergillus heteromorphus CBS 117.55]
MRFQVPEKGTRRFANAGRCMPVILDGHAMLECWNIGEKAGGTCRAPLQRGSPLGATYRWRTLHFDGNSGCEYHSLHVPADRLEYNNCHSTAYTRSSNRHVNGSTRQNQYNLLEMPRQSLSDYTAARFIFMSRRMFHGCYCLPCNATRILACCHFPA